MTEQQKQFPEFYVTAPQPCPYLPGRLERKLFTHLTHDKPLEHIDRLAERLVSAAVKTLLTFPIAKAVTPACRSGCWPPISRPTAR